MSTEEAKGMGESKSAAPPALDSPEPAAQTASGGESGMTSAEQTHVFADLVRKLNALEKLNLDLKRDGEDITLPRIVMCGAQSAGKSSVLQAIVGKTFIPTGTGMVTRVPLHLQLYTLPEEDPPETYAVFDVQPEKKFYSMKKVQQRIEALTNQLVPAPHEIAIKPITLKFYSRHLPQLSLVDLPGIVQVASADQPKDLPGRIKEMVKTYVDEPNTIILAVAPADKDLRNSPALQLAREVDPDGRRTIGVLTKVDKLDGRAASETDRILSYIVNKGEGTKFALPVHGYVAVMTNTKIKTRRTPRHQDTFTVLRQQEEHYFANSELYQEHRAICGIPFLTDKLRIELGKAIERCLPDIESELRTRVSGIKQTLGELQPKLNPEDLNQMLVDAAECCKFWLASNVDGNIKQNAVRKNVDLKRRLLSTRLKKQFAKYRGYLDDRLALVEPDALRNAVVLTLKETSGNVERQVIQRIFKDILCTFRRPTMELMAVCAQMIYNDLKAIKTNLAEVCPPAHELLIKVLTTGFKAQIEECRQFVTNFLDLEVFYVNLNHPEFQRYVKGLVGQASNPRMEEVTRPVEVWVRPQWSQSACCYRCFNYLAVLVGGRHHCRSCGGTVCQRHSSDAEGLTLTVRLPGGGNSERVCDQCFEKWETQNRVEQGLGERGGASHAAVVSPFAADLAAMEAADKRASSPEAPAEASVSAGAGATAGAGAEAAPGEDGAEGAPADAAVTAAGDKPTVAQPVTSSTKQRMEPPLVKLPPDDAVLSLQVRPPARECRMLKNKKDERVVFKLCQGAMLYADLMKDKLADHIPKVLQFMLLERSRESIFNGLSKQLRRSDVHRQFVKHMTPHLMDIQSQVDKLSEQLESYAAMERILFGKSIVSDMSTGRTSKDAQKKRDRNRRRRNRDRARTRSSSRR